MSNKAIDPFFSHLIVLNFTNVQYDNHQVLYDEHKISICSIMYGLYVQLGSIERIGGQNKSLQVSMKAIARYRVNKLSENNGYLRWWAWHNTHPDRLLICLIEKECNEVRRRYMYGLPHSWLIVFCVQYIFLSI